MNRSSDAEKPIINIDANARNAESGRRVSVLFAMAFLVGCASAGRSAAIYKPTPTAVPTSPIPSPSALPLLGEMLSWSGEAAGTLTKAYADCHNPPDNSIAMFSNSDSNLAAGIPRGGPGTVDVTSFPNGYGTVSLHLAQGIGPGSLTLFLATSGTVTYGAGGNSGSVDVWMAAQSNVPTSPSVHLTGTWRCA